jgi:VCBS repeat-containing protein
MPYSRPDARDDHASTREGKPVTIDLLDNDRGATGIWKINGRTVEPGDTVRLDSGARITVGKDGKVLYDPSDSKKFDALDSGELGFDSFRYSAFDNEFGTDTATVRIKIKGVNDAPVAHDDVVYVPFKPIPYPLPTPIPVDPASAEAGHDGSIVTTLAIGEEGDPDPLPVPRKVEISPLANDKDPDGDDLRIAQIDGKAVSPGDSVKLESGAVVTVSKDGDTLIYKGDIIGYDGPLRSDEAPSWITPEPFPYFADSFTYRASDGDALSNAAQVTVVQTPIHHYDDLG